MPLTDPSGTPDFWAWPLEADHIAVMDVWGHWRKGPERMGFWVRELMGLRRKEERKIPCGVNEQ